MWANLLQLGKFVSISQYRAFVNPSWTDLLEQLELGSPIVRAEGTYIYNQEGRAFLDLVAGFGSVCLGHNHPVLVSEIFSELQKNPAYLNPWGYSREAGPLAECLIRHAGASFSKVHFSNTGAEAVESAVKFAQVVTQRTNVVAVREGFHGLTQWATQAAGNAMWRHRIKGGGCGIDWFDINDLEQARALLATKTYAALILEPIQGSGNGASWRSDVLDELIHFSNKNGTLVIFDEVMTGLGRTGSWFAYQQLLPKSRSPDLLVVSKALSGGIVPVSAVLMAESTYTAMFAPPGMSKSHGSTYSGNHLGLFIANRTLQIIEKENLIENVKRMGVVLKNSLNKLQCQYKILSRVSGCGLVWSLSFGEQDEEGAAVASEVCISLLSSGVLLSMAAHSKNCLRLTPPLTISEQEIFVFIKALGDALEGLEC